MNVIWGTNANFSYYGIHAYEKQNVIISDNCVIGPNVTIENNTVINANSKISNCKICKIMKSS